MIALAITLSHINQTPASGHSAVSLRRALRGARKLYCAAEPLVASVDLIYISYADALPSANYNKNNIKISYADALPSANYNKNNITHYICVAVDVTDFLITKSNDASVTLVNVSCAVV